MSASEREVVALSAQIDAVDREVPLHDEFVELDSFGDGMIDDEPHLTVFYNKENADEWLRFESRLLVDLTEVE